MPQGKLKEMVTVKPHPGGVAGAMMSLDEVARRAWTARNDPRVRAWALRELVKAGSPTGTRDKVQAIMVAFRKKVPYVSDPVRSEFIASPIQLLCLDDHGLCIPGGDCDEFTVGILGAILSIGIPGQVVGASYKDPVDQPAHVYGRFQDDGGSWVDFDGTTTFAVGNVHPAARTWIIDPDKGVGAAGLPGGDFVGVSRPPSVGLDAGPTYQALLQQLLTQDLPALQAAWNDVQQAINGDPGNDPCSGLGGPASLVQSLQDISDQACTIAHNASVAAFGYTGNCGGVGADRALNAQNATEQACTLHYYWPGPEYGDYGTAFVTGSQQATCLDPSFTSAVGSQVAAAEYAVAEAQATAEACASHPVLTRRLLRPSGPSVTLGPRGFALAGEWGLGLVTPSDIFSYRALWDKYVTDTIKAASSCAAAYAAVAATQTDPNTKATLTAIGVATQKDADALLSEWNVYANSQPDFIVLEGESILRSFQNTVQAAGDTRERITTGGPKTGSLKCALTYVDSNGQVVSAIDGADPSTQAQVIAHIEGLGILASGVLQILLKSGANGLLEAGSAKDWAAKNVSNVTGALSNPGVWIAVTAVAGAVVVYEIWPRSR